MHWKEISDVERLFAFPSIGDHTNKQLLMNYQRNLKTSSKLTNQSTTAIIPSESPEPKRSNINPVQKKRTYEE